MEKIASFTVNHLTLRPGVYVSRKDHVGAEVLRFTPSSIWVLLSFATIRNTKIRLSISDQWAAAPDFI